MRAAVLLLALAGCATVPQPTTVIGRAEPVIVHVPVVTLCVDPAQVEPVPPSSMPPRTAGVAELANGAAADALKYREMAIKQEKMLRACANKGVNK